MLDFCDERDARRTAVVTKKDLECRSCPQLCPESTESSRLLPFAAFCTLVLRYIALTDILLLRQVFTTRSLATVSTSSTTLHTYSPPCPSQTSSRTCPSRILRRTRMTRARPSPDRVSREVTPLPKPPLSASLVTFPHSFTLATLTHSLEHGKPKDSSPSQCWSTLFSLPTTLTKSHPFHPSQTSHA